jgi:hypothetical protein
MKDQYNTLISEGTKQMYLAFIEGKLSKKEAEYFEKEYIDTGIINDFFDNAPEPEMADVRVPLSLKIRLGIKEK